MTERLDQLCQLQKICLNELDRAQKNSEQYSSHMMQLTEKIKQIWKNNNCILKEYDSFVTNITDIMDFARKFNLQIYMHNRKLKEMQCLFSKMIQKNEIQSKMKTGHLYPAEEFETTLDAGEEFVYPKLNLRKMYEKNAIVNGKVCYIKNLKDLSFYILDMSSTYIGAIADLSKSLELRQYFNPPVPNEIFGYVLDKNIFRAVLSPHLLYDEEMCEKVWPCYILDIGEILYFKSNDEKNILYKLTKDQKAIPAQAILCQLSTHNKNPFITQQELEEKLKALEYEFCELKILATFDNYLQVEFVDKSKKSFIANNIKLSNFKNLSLAHKMPKVNHKPLSKVEIETLNEEPLNTSNVMKAIMGYDPTDDKHICRFYDTKTGACFKGANCKLLHIQQQPHGWTKDVIPSTSKTDYRHPTSIFPTDSIISITPTYVGRLDRFYAQINDHDKPFIPLVWNDEDIPSWKLYKKPPYMFELVLARYIDGLWYRAKVMSHDDEYTMFNILYIDYAILCRIEGVREKLSLSKEERNTALEILSELILNKTMDVKVVSQYEDIFIRFVDQQKYPLPKKLIEIGFLESFEK
ncbi:krimper isoform 2-T2 [Cochliomyia hominivorax]